MMMSKQTQRGNCCSDQYNYCPLCFIIYFASHCSPRDFHLLSNSQQQLIYGLAVSLSEVRRGLGLMTRDQLMFSCYHGKLSFHLVVNHHSAQCWKCSVSPKYLLCSPLPQSHLSWKEHEPLRFIKSPLVEDNYSHCTDINAVRVLSQIRAGW